MHSVRLGRFSASVKFVAAAEPCSPSVSVPSHFVVAFITFLCLFSFGQAIKQMSSNLNNKKHFAHSENGVLFNEAKL